VRQHVEPAQAGGSAPEAAAQRQASVGSNPVSRTIKVAAFVYQDKGGYFMLFVQKTAFSKKNGPPSNFAAVPRLDFCVFSVKKLVYFCFYFTEIKYAQKS